MNTNIILLIGMPGCGKSTIGELLSKKINYNFYDMDKYIEEISNSTVKELFSISEENFRDYETKACKELSNKEKIVISSGGGVIKKKENIDFFKNKGKIIFIDRPIENILKDVDTESRPLLSDGKSKLYSLYSERYNLYNDYCDVKIVNDKTIGETLDKLIKIIEQ